MHYIHIDIYILSLQLHIYIGQHICILTVINNISETKTSIKNKQNKRHMDYGVEM